MTRKNTFLFEMAKKMTMFLREGLLTPVRLWPRVRRHPFRGATDQFAPRKDSAESLTLNFSFRFTPKLNCEKCFEFVKRFRRRLNIFYNFTFVQRDDAFADFNCMNKIVA